MSFVGRISLINFSLAHSRVRSGSGPGRANAVWVPESVNVSKMVQWIGPANTAVNMQLGIYDSAGNRLARTAVFSPAAGFNFRDLEAPVVLLAGSVYYFAFTWTTGEIVSLYAPYADDDRPTLGAAIPLGALPASITPVATATYTAWWLGAVE